MIVVSNTSPLTNLAAIGQFHLLHRLYGQIHIPDAVWNELNGVLGILLNAKRRRHIAAVMPHVIALRESAGFYLSDRVRQVVRDLAGE